MAKLLLIETATNICSVGFAEDDKFHLELLAVKPMSHTEELTLLIQDGLSHLGWEMKELDGLILSKGPGSYTALRVGAATAKGICFSLNIPLIAVDTLHSLAWAMSQTGVIVEDENNLFFPMIDARRMEIYGAIYEAKQNIAVHPKAIILDQDYLEAKVPKNGKLHLGGSGAAKAKALSASENIILIPIECSAKHLLNIGFLAFQAGKFEDVAYFKPQYLKPPNITTPKPIWK